MHISLCAPENWVRWKGLAIVYQALEVNPRKLPDSGDSNNPWQRRNILKFSSLNSKQFSLDDLTVLEKALGSESNRPEAKSEILQLTRLWHLTLGITLNFLFPHLSSAMIIDSHFIELWRCSEFTCHDVLNRSNSHHLLNTFFMPGSGLKTPCTSILEVTSTLQSKSCVTVSHWKEYWGVKVKQLAQGPVAR